MVIASAAAAAVLAASVVVIVWLASDDDAKTASPSARTTPTQTQSARTTPAQTTPAQTTTTQTTPAQGTPAPTGDAPSRSIRTIASWVATNIPSDTRVMTDASTVSVLRQAGVDRAVDDTESCDRIGFVVATAALRAAADANETLRQCLSRTVPVARIGSADDAVQVGVVTADPDETRRRFSEAADARRRAGQSLTANPGLSMPEAVRSVLAAGRLDLRAEATLVTLAEQYSVRIIRIVGDPAEAAAGLPARTVEVEGVPSDIGFASEETVFRPASVAPIAGGVVRLTWAFTTEPVPVLD